MRLPFTGRQTGGGEKAKLAMQGVQIGAEKRIRLPASKRISFGYGVSAQG